MNVSEMFSLLSSQGEDIAAQLVALPAKQKKTAKALLESSVRLAYVLYATEDYKNSALIVDVLAAIPFANDYDYWTWIEAALVLQGTLAVEQSQRDKYLSALACAKDAFNTGNELEDEINAEVHKEFLNGEMLEADFDSASDVKDEFEMRVTYLMDILKIQFFGGSENWSPSATSIQVSETVKVIRQRVADLGIYMLPPYK